jgi:hypothetical protein
MPGRALDHGRRTEDGVMIDDERVEITGEHAIRLEVAHL